MYARSRLPTLEDGDTRAGKGLKASGDGELVGDVKRLHNVRRHSILFDEIEWAETGGQRDNFGVLGELPLDALTVYFEDLDNVLIQNPLLLVPRENRDEILPRKDALKIALIEHAALSAQLVGQTKRNASDGDGISRR